MTLFNSRMFPNAFIKKNCYSLVCRSLLRYDLSFGRKFYLLPDTLRLVCRIIFAGIYTVKYNKAGVLDFCSGLDFSPELCFFRKLRYF